MQVSEATMEDFESWLLLAAEVEELFGPMVNEPEFHQVLVRKIARGSAFCVRRADGPPGTPLAGGLLLSQHSQRYGISWLVVSAAWRSNGVGKALVRAALRRSVTYPCTLEVDTFGIDHPGARSRGFYEQLGFRAEENLAPGPEGGSRQMYRLALDSPPPWLA
jgi:ribosomal protein S18 acetylase RimI-like enzyme